ncbi:methyltransferase domain-containing protein [Actinoplanes sp. URMC 104]|uniref:methyltransferase domain-containing protein n=1 Tax=Actinoplanes sp. URMC 104 TaxID=3423409 RepID=UPI003F1CF1D7
MPETHFDAWIAPRYAALWPELFAPALVDATVTFLAELAAGGPALEFGIGTGRIAVPLSRRGVAVHGIELSPAMAAEVDGVPVTLGDYATTTVAGSFALVYLLRNTITNLTTQDEQVQAFRNAAEHLAPGGYFVVENYIPRLRTTVFAATSRHVGYEEYDTATQIAVSHHWWVIDGELRAFSSPHRYVWPAELDLMARLAGLVPHERVAGWDRAPFTGDSTDHVSVWRKPARAASPIPAGPGATTIAACGSGSDG